MATHPRGMKVYVHGNNSEEDLWYCIDLDDEISVSLVAKIGCERDGGWALMGDHIYWAGGTNMKALDQLGRRSITSMDLLRHNISDKDLSKWETVSSSKKLPRENPRVFTLNNKIHVMGGSNSIYIPEDDDDNESDGDERVRHCGEVYNIDTHTWDLLAFNVKDYAGFSFNQTTALFMDHNKEIVALSYSLQMGRFLFYYVGTDDFIVEDHKTSFPLGPQSLKQEDYYQRRRRDILINTMMNVRPVVRDSTLYWFTYDFYMYGYDFVQKQWFSSEEPVKKEKEKEELLSLPEPMDHFCPVSPILVDLYDDASFLVIVPATGGKLGVAFLAVSKCTRTYSLTVSLKSSHTLSPTPDGLYFYPTDAMAILKYIGPSTMRGQSNPATVVQVLFRLSILAVYFENNFLLRYLLPFSSS
ncbi:uncharacterized protein LOC132044495 [Lycium ferocissimum]|uniref:uncharacterized protein LOC132044495 n=1 Tax=Lycium ferocissimum TaxID=112874 RepID=UPI002816358E|nr:uncharacterized protein LOC132044495 [Lycium ferocissimum]